jgi:hypothetical protein
MTKRPTHHWMLEHDQQVLPGQRPQLAEECSHRGGGLSARLLAVVEFYVGVGVDGEDGG